MSATLLVSLAVAIVGLLVFALLNGKASQAGLYAFAVGLLAGLLQLGAKAIHW